MSERQDFVALEWIRKEIEVTLQQAQQELEAAAQNPDDQASMRACLTAVHQVHGTLKMVQLEVATQLAEEMEAVAQALMNGEVKALRRGQETLMQAMLQLPGYLEGVQKKQGESRELLLPMINSLRRARGEEPIQGDAATASLLVPDVRRFNRPVDGDARSAYVEAGGAATVAKVRRRYQRLLVAVLKRQDVRKNLDELLKLFTMLSRLTGKSPIGHLSRVGTALIEGLASGTIKLTGEINQGLRTLDRVLKDLADGGAEGLGQKLPEDLIVALVRPVINAEKQTARSGAIKRLYAMERKSVVTEPAQEQRVILGPDAETMSAVVKIIVDEIVGAKDKLDLFVRAEVQNLGDLLELLPGLEQVTNTLGVVGLAEYQSEIDAQIDLLKKAAESGQELSEEMLLSIAGAFLRVETNLSSLIERGEESTEQQPSGGLDEAMAAVARETRRGLAGCIEAVNKFVEERFDREHIATVPGELAGLRGGLTIMGQARAGDVLYVCSRYVAVELIEKEVRPTQRAMEDLADILTSVDYFLERLLEDPNEPYMQMISVAERSLNRLGYEVRRVLTEMPVDADADVVEEREEIEAEAEAREIEAAADEVDAEAADNAEEIAEEAEEAEEAAGPQGVEARPDAELLEIFVDEAAGVLKTMHDAFPTWRATPGDADALEELRRAFHTLKGSGRMVGAEKLGDVAWAFENMLNRVIDKSISAGDAMRALIERVIEAIPGGVTAFQEGRQAAEDYARLIELADRVAAGGEVALYEIEPAEITEMGPEAAEIEEVTFGEPEAEIEEFALERAAGDETGIDPELLQIFMEEAEMHLSALESFVQEASAGARSIPGALITSLHTLKGSAAMAEIGSVVALAAPLERMARLMFEQGVRMEGESLEIAKRACDLLRTAHADISNYTRDLVSGTEPLVERLNAFNDGLTGVGGIAQPIADRELAPRFTFDGIDLLLDAEEILDGWDRVRIGALQEELNLVRERAAAGARPELEQVASLLLEAYGEIELSAAPGAVILDALKWGHESVIALLDRIAAHQELEVDPALIELLSSVGALAGVRTGMDEGAAPAETRAPEGTPLEEASAEQAGPLTFDEIEERAPAEVAAAASAESGQTAPEPATAQEIAEPVAEAEVMSDEIVDEIDDDVLPIFVGEADELLENIDQSILDWSENRDDRSHLDNLLRHLHTIKGGSRLAGIATLGEVSHRFESFLIDIKDTEASVDDQFFADLYRRQDEIVRRVGICRQLANGEVTKEQAVEMMGRAIPTGSAGVQASAGSASPAPSLSPTAEPGDRVEDEPDESVLPSFIEEADELLESIDQTVAEWNDDRDDRSHLDNLMRQLHTMKGGARLAGLKRLGEYSHSFETMLLEIKNNDIAVDNSFFADLNRRQDELIRRISVYRMLLAGEVTVDRLHELTRTPAAGQQRTRAAQAQQAESAAPPQEMIRVSADLVEDLISLAAEFSITRGRVQQQISSFAEHLEEMEVTINRVRDHVRRLEIEAESRETVLRRRREEEGSPFDELEMDRYTMLQEISRALSEGTSDMLDLKGTLLDTSKDADTLLVQQARISGELQEGLTRTRMVPFSRLLPRLRRITRQISEEVDKQVRFDAYNIEGELDRNVLERIVAPLEHMLRNAVDHGIEPAEVREAAGKPAMGHVSLRLSREGGYVVIKISDDGGGIDVNAIRAKAIEDGLMTEESQLSDKEILQFITKSGFSTAKRVTQISGRGVGMDVVDTELRQLGGSLTIESTLGVGSEFSIRIPFTVSINRALMVVVKDETYAVPLNTIEGIVRVSPYELEAYYEPNAPMFEYAGQPYRLFYMGQFLAKAEKPNLAGQIAPLPVILARSGDHAIALQVDSMIGSREVVVKALGRQLSNISGVSGATIMGDGSVVIILDVMSLVRSGQTRGLANEIGKSPEVAAAHVRRVLIVDDSVTVRKVTSRLIERQGWDVMLAKDGMDAMDQLQDIVPDVMLLDIEMPRMDGFEVLRSVRRDERLKSLPIIMITSRTGEKHRQEAMDLGVNEYLGKPFQEEQLLRTIEEVLSGGRH